MNDSIFLNNGKSIRAYTHRQLTKLKSIDRGYCDVVIRYNDNNEALKIAKTFKKLCKDPSFTVNVKFQKIN